jgi:ribose transport system substrate-binding protein
MRARRIKAGVTALALAASVGLATVGTATSSQAAIGSNIKIGLSNSYAGNSWRQQMLSDFSKAANSAKSKGQIKSFSIVNSNNDATQQISQLKAMILQGYNVIIIDAASPTALNGVIAQACKAKIKVVVFDSLTTSPCAYKIESNYVNYGTIETNFVAKQLANTGNVLEIRGVAGTSVDVDISKGIHSVVAQHAGMKIVGSVNGNWSTTVSQQAVTGIIPSLPKVDAVVGQGGDGAGAVRAFQAANLPVPVTIMGNRGDELRVWKELVTANPKYKTMSISSMPGMSTVAFWVAYILATGKSVPKSVFAPLLQIDSNHLDAWIKATPPTGVSSKVFTLAETQSLVNFAIAKKPKYVVYDLPSK